MADKKNKGNPDKPKGSAINAPPPVMTYPPFPPQPTTAPSSSNNIRAVTPGWQWRPGNPGTMAEATTIINSRVIDASKIYNGGADQNLPKKPGAAVADMASYPEGAPSIIEQTRALQNDPQLIFEFVYDNIDWQPGWGLMKGPLGCLLDQSGNAFDQCSLLVALLTQAGYTANFVLGQIQLTTAQFDAWFGTDSEINSYCCYYYAQNANIPCDTPVESGDVWSMIMGHVWVVVVVDGNTYVLDPSYKTYTRKSPVSDLATILDYTQSAFLSDAESGATVDGSGNFVQNMNTTNVAADLMTYTQNLISYINSNTVGSAPAGTAGVDDILGGQSIVPITLPFTWETSLSYQYSVTDTWTAIPLSYKSTLRVQYLFISGDTYDIDQTFTSDQLAGARLTLTFNSGLYPVLTLNAVVVQTGTTAQGEGTWNSALLTVTHNAYTYTFPSWWQQFIYAGQYYLIGNAWGNLGGGQETFHQTQLAAALADSLSTSEAVNGEWMSTIWFNWASQVSRVGDLAGRINSTYTNPFHQVGIVSMYFTDDVPTPGTDIGGVAGYTATLNYDFTQLPITNTVVDMHGVALEAASLAQFNGVTPSVSTTMLIDKANRTAAVTIGGTVTVGDVLTITVHDPALSGGMKSDSYTVRTDDTLTSIATELTAVLTDDSSLSAIGVTASGVVVLPSGAVALQVSSTSINQTYYTSSVTGAETETMSIAFSRIYLANPSNWDTGFNVESYLEANGYSTSSLDTIGGYATTTGESVLIGDQPYYVLGDWVGEGYWVFYSYSYNGGALGLILDTGKGGSGGPGAGKPGTGSIPGDSPTQTTGADPVGLFSGDFIYNRTDMTIGSQPFPYSLSFERAYDSANQYAYGPLGWGWTHNHAITATVGSDGLLAMGNQFAVQAAASIVELYVSMNLASDSTQPITKLVTMSLSDKWWLDQLVNNTVVVAFSNVNQIFVKQPGGSYTAPSAFPSTLALSSGLYTLTTPQGVKYNFNSSGQISSWVFPSGVTISYTYSSGILSTISNGMDRTLTLNYDDEMISSVTDGTGREVKYFYDDNFDLVEFVDTLDYEIQYQYEITGRMNSYILPANPSTYFIINEYDSLSRVQTQRNALLQTTTCYFAGTRTQIDDPVGNAQVLYFSSLGSVIRSINALGFETDTVYDGLNRPIQTTLPEGNQTLVTYDANNNVLSATFVPKPGSGLTNIVWSYTYNTTWAKVHQQTDGNGNVTTYNYDPTLGNLTSIVGPAVTGGTPQLTMTYNARGQMITQAINTTDVTSIVMQLNYDTTTEKLTSAVLDYSTGSGHLNLTSYYGYDSVGNYTSFTDPNSNETTFVFNSERRMTQVTAPTPFNYLTNYGYDANSNLTSIANEVSSGFLQTTSYAYTVTQKLYTITDPLLRVTTADYDGADRLESVVDAQSREYQYAYDQLNRIYTLTDPTDTVCVTLTYTDNGYLETVKDANSNITQYRNDGFDRISTITFADMTTQSNTLYDDNGNLLTYTTRSGNSIVGTYDALNRLSTKTPYDQPEITYTYNLASLLTEVNKAGSGDPSDGNFQFFYDTAGRFYQEEYPDSKTVTNVLDSNGNSTKTTWPDGYYVTCSFDQLNRLTNIYLNGSETSAAAFEYDALSRRVLLTLGNGAVVDYVYALNNDLTELTNTYVGAYQRYDYVYNNVHQIVGTTMVDESYMWEPSSSVSTTYGTADDVNKYPSVGAATFTYDGNKNLTYDGTYTYSYDIENHLLAVYEGETLIASYVYDPLQRQAQKTVGTTSTRFIYSGWQEIADYIDSTLNNRYIFAGFDEPIIQVTSGGAVSYFHRDQQNTIVATTNNAGAVTNKFDYAPFGESAALSGTTFGYTGQRYDAETGLYYFKMRYYSPPIGRFLQPDPIGYAASTLNLYAYANNDPLQFRDPLGLDFNPSWVPLILPNNGPLVPGVDGPPPGYTPPPVTPTPTPPQLPPIITFSKPPPNRQPFLIPRYTTYIPINGVPTPIIYFGPPPLYVPTPSRQAPPTTTGTGTGTGTGTEGEGQNPLGPYPELPAQKNTGD